MISGKNLLASLLIPCLFIVLVVPLPSRAQTQEVLEEQVRSLMLQLLKLLQLQLEDLLRQRASLVARVGLWKYNDPRYQRAFADKPLAERESIQFNVVNGQLSGIDNSTHPIYRELWRIFSGALPDKYLHQVATFEVRNEPTVKERAFVSRRRAADSPQGWHLSVNLGSLSLLGAKAYSEAFEIMIHEAAHIITLDKRQLDYTKGKSMCLTYFIDRLQACSDSNSYLSDFATFWTPEHIRWFNKHELTSKIDDNQARLESRLYFEAHKNEFITRKATTYGTEDIAESMSYFLMYEAPKNETHPKSAKILIFYRYPELLDIRTEVQSLLDDGRVYFGGISALDT
jgi:hypothetical protein